MGCSVSNILALPDYIKEKYEFIDTNPICEGGFGKIYRIRDKNNLTEYVLKKKNILKKKKIFY